MTHDWHLRVVRGSGSLTGLPSCNPIPSLNAFANSDNMFRPFLSKWTNLWDLGHTVLTLCSMLLLYWGKSSWR